MDKKTINKIQLKLCNELMLYYSGKGFKLNKKNWNIFKEPIYIPFYPATTRGPYFTIEPCFVLRNKDTINHINSIIKNPILTNGIFKANHKLANMFGESDFDNVIENNFKFDSCTFEWQIYSESDLLWVRNMHIHYMEKVGWQFIDNLKNEESIYKFYNRILREYLADDTERSVLEKPWLIDSGAHTTLIYLGLKNKMKDVNELIYLTYEKVNGTLYTNPIKYLEKHFL